MGREEETTAIVRSQVGPPGLTLCPHYGPKTRDELHRPQRQSCGGDAKSDSLGINSLKRSPSRQLVFKFSCRPKVMIRPSGGGAHKLTIGEA